jgi:hypothetical protein
MEVTLKPGMLGLIIGTRAALAFGVGLLVASRIPESRRRSLALTLIGIGAASTVPLALSVFSKRLPEPESPDFV